MAWVAVDIYEDENENICYQEIMMEVKMTKLSFGYQYHHKTQDLPDGSIEKLINRKLTWQDEPVELSREINEN